MKVTGFDVPGPLLIEPNVFGDERGFFLESWNAEAFAHAGIDAAFVQDNHSRSDRGVLRGLHLQRPHTQGKLVRVVNGAVWDVAVDLRDGSPTFGRWVAAELSGENNHVLWVPPGFAHGFLTLTDGTDFLYKCTDLYHPEAEHTLAWDDPTVGVEWPLDGIEPQLSAKDRVGQSLADVPRC